jgi:hypothetical protein
MLFFAPAEEFEEDECEIYCDPSSVCATDAVVDDSSVGFDDDAGNGGGGNFGVDDVDIGNGTSAGGSDPFRDGGNVPGLDASVAVNCDTELVEVTESLDKELKLVLLLFAAVNLPRDPNPSSDKGDSAITIELVLLLTDTGILKCPAPAPSPKTPPMKSAPTPPDILSKETVEEAAEAPTDAEVPDKEA